VNLNVPLLGGAAFAASAWFGMLLGEAICGGREPSPGGSARITPPALLFVLCGAATGVSIVMHGFTPPQVITLAILVLALAAAAAANLSGGIVPDAVTVVPLAAILLSSLLQARYAPLLSVVLITFPLAIVAAFSPGRGLSWGDVKLGALGAAILGASGVMVAFIAAGLTAFVASRLAPSAARPLALAPYIVLGIAVALVAGPLG
jgi:prepilin signal peptidase PulO-like enzyme (type II secretory pathway)